MNKRRMYMDKDTQTRIRDLILSVVPEDGSTIGNVSLFREVQQALEADGREYDEAAVNAVRERLIAEGLLGKGRGRGGSVYRKAVNPGAESAGASKAAHSGQAPAATLGKSAPGNGPYGSYSYPARIQPASATGGFIPKNT